MIGVYSSVCVNKPVEVYSINLGCKSNTVESEKCLNSDKREEYCHPVFVTLQQLPL